MVLKFFFISPAVYASSNMYFPLHSFFARHALNDRFFCSICQEVLLEFRAGKMLMDGNRVIPDTRKGLIRIGRVWPFERSIIELSVLISSHLRILSFLNASPKISN